MSNTILFRIFEESSANTIDKYIITCYLILIHTAKGGISMLLEFACSNHKSIRGEVLFSALAGKDNTFEEKNFDYPEKPLKYKHIRRISD